MPETATAQQDRLEKLMQPRRIRARTLTNVIYRALFPFVADRNRSETFDTIERALTIEGVDIVTDDDRARAGLPNRGPEGWTAAELAALEGYRLEVMSKPFAGIIPTLTPIDQAPLVLTLKSHGFHFEDKQQRQMLMSETHAERTTMVTLDFLYRLAKGRSIVIRQEPAR